MSYAPLHGPLGRFPGRPPRGPVRASWCRPSADAVEPPAHARQSRRRGRRSGPVPRTGPDRTRCGRRRRRCARPRPRRSITLPGASNALTELDGRVSLLNPVWYAGSFVIGALAGALGDRTSLGFIAETERQVESHLQRPLGSIAAGRRAQPRHPRANAARRDRAWRNGSLGRQCGRVSRCARRHAPDVAVDDSRLVLADDPYCLRFRDLCNKRWRQNGRFHDHQIWERPWKKWQKP